MSIYEQIRYFFCKGRIFSRAYVMMTNVAGHFIFITVSCIILTFEKVPILHQNRNLKMLKHICGNIGRSASNVAVFRQHFSSNIE